MTSPQRFKTLPDKFNRLVFALALALALTLALPLPQPASAVALGEAVVHSALGQKLEADIEIAALSALEAESLTVRLAAPEIFAKAGLEYMPALRSLRLSMEKRGERPVIHLGSELAISDPVLILLIEINANGNRTTRQYALLLDPPVVNEEPRSASVLPVVPAAPLPAPAVTATPQSASASSAPSSGDAPVTASPNPIIETAKLARKPSLQAEPKLIKVRRGDTLARIAKDVAIKEASLDQVLIALLHANPQAFAANNIHRIKTGSVLKVPDDAVIQAVDQAEARQQIMLQTTDFHRYRSALAAAPASAKTAASASAESSVPPPANRSSSGSVGVQQRDAGKTTETRDQLKLSAPQDAAGKQPGDANVLNQIANEKALADAKARIAELEKNVSDMQQLSLHNQTMAEAQQRAEAASAVPATTPLASALTTSPGTSPSNSPSNSSTAPPAVTNDVVEAPRKKAAAPNLAKPVNPVQTEPDLTTRLLNVADQLTADPRPVLAVLGLLVVVVLVLSLHRRRQRTSAPVERTEPAADAQSVFGQSGGRNVDTSNSVFHSNFVPSVSQLDANEVDAIAEADVYIAYGRDEQAEEILLDALKQHPGRHALRVKLLEIYAQRKDLQKFGTLASELRVLTHGEGADWQQAAQIGRQLDPGNLLYGGEPAVTATPAPSAISASSSAQTIDRNDGPLSFSPASTLPAFSSPPLAPAAPAPASASTSTVASASAASSLATPSGASRPDTSIALASPVEDFEIKLEGLLDERRKDQGAGLSVAGLSLLPQSPAEALSASQTSTPAITDFQLSGIGISDADASTGSITSPEQIALKTKIDLALACQEIGDKEGARELLTEVAAARHAALASRAQSLLAQLA